MTVPGQTMAINGSDYEIYDFLILLLGREREVDAVSHATCYGTGMR